MSAANRRRKQMKLHRNNRSSSAAVLITDQAALSTRVRSVSSPHVKIINQRTNASETKKKIPLDRNFNDLIESILFQSFL